MADNAGYFVGGKERITNPLIDQKESVLTPPESGIENPLVREPVTGNTTETVAPQLDRAALKGKLKAILSLTEQQDYQDPVIEIQAEEEKAADLEPVPDATIPQQVIDETDNFSAKEMSTKKPTSMEPEIIDLDTNQVVDTRDHSAIATETEPLESSEQAATLESEKFNQKLNEPKETDEHTPTTIEQRTQQLQAQISLNKNLNILLLMAKLVNHQPKLEEEATFIA